MTGRPVSLDMLLDIDMPAPRALEDARVLSWQGELLSFLQKDLEEPAA
jgi:putative hydroxymethylpyrimidine transport system ATP-binding protein